MLSPQSASHIRRLMRIAASVSLTLSISACGLNVPKMQPFASDDARTEGLKESSLSGFIKCELHFAVQDLLRIQDNDDANTKRDPTNYPPHPRIDWIRNWGANVSMKVVVDEKSTLAPGLSFNSPMETVVSTFKSGGPVNSPQSFAFGLGASVSSQATRTENISFYYPFSDLLMEGHIEKPFCSEHPAATIDADLKIDEFLRSKYEAATTGGLLLHKVGVPADGSISPFETLTYEVQFIVSQGANATPTWKLIRISANPTGPLLALTRSRTDDIIMTFGEAVKDEKGKTLSPSPAAQLQLQANLIGQAVAAALRNQP